MLARDSSTAWGQLGGAGSPEEEATLLQMCVPGGPESPENGSLAGEDQSADPNPNLHPNPKLTVTHMRTRENQWSDSEPHLDVERVLGPSGHKGRKPDTPSSELTWLHRIHPSSRTMCLTCGSAITRLQRIRTGPGGPHHNKPWPTRPASSPAQQLSGQC